MSSFNPRIPSQDGEPAWEAAYFFPPQGRWSEEDFLQFHTNRMAELVNGHLEILPMPTWLHQLIVDFLMTSIKEYLKSSEAGGVALFAPLPTRLFPGTIREPDILYVLEENLPKSGVKYPSKIDLAIEVVSEGAEARKRDYEDKRIDYAKAGVHEYWIVDPEQSLLTVLTLDGSEYRVAHECRPGDTARSLLLDGLTIAFDDILALGANKDK
jgi:Uma2 family endonuclease